MTRRYDAVLQNLQSHHQRIINPPISFHSRLVAPRLDDSPMTHVLGVRVVTQHSAKVMKASFLTQHRVVVFGSAVFGGAVALCAGFESLRLHHPVKSWFFKGFLGSGNISASFHQIRRLSYVFLTSLSSKLLTVYGCACHQDWKKAHSQAVL